MYIKPWTEQEDLILMSGKYTKDELVKMLGRSIMDIEKQRANLNNPKNYITSQVIYHYFHGKDEFAIAKMLKIKPSRVLSIIDRKIFGGENEK